MYSQKIIKRFKNPKFAGEIKNPDAIGQVGNKQCLLSNEKIFLDGEFQEIDKSKKNSRVISHDSSKSNILNKFSRSYNGEILTLKNCLGRISLTPEHLIYALKLPKHYNFLRTKNKQKLIPAWYHAEDLNKRDIIIYPVNNKTKDINFLKIDIPKPKYDFRSKELPKMIPLNSELMRLFGYFISEGNIQDKPTRTYISFSLNINETNIIKDIKNISKQLFGLDVKIKEKPKNNLTIVYLYNAQLARFFKNLFGNGAQQKKLPEFIMELPIDKQKSLIEGLWKGDGYVNLNRDGPRAGYSTISYQLVQQIKLLLLRQKIVSSFYEEKEKIVNGINHKVSYRLHVGQRDSLINLCYILGIEYSPKSYRSIDSWFNVNSLYTPITKIEKANYNGEVYNLEVENTHSFISDAFSLHNCGDVMKIYLKVDEKDKIIKDIKFQTYGCIAAIAASDAMCELAKGKTLKQAESIKYHDILKKMGGDVPQIKVHCSVLGTEALREAIKNYNNSKNK